MTSAGGSSQHLQQRVGRFLREVFGVLDDEDAVATLIRLQHGITLQLSNLLHANGGAPRGATITTALRYDSQVRVQRAGDAPALAAFGAWSALCIICGAVHEARQVEREGHLADAGGAREQPGMRHAPACHASRERADCAVVSDGLPVCRHCLALVPFQSFGLCRSWYQVGAGR